MVDFSKKLSKGEVDKKTNPLEIYENLDRRSETGPLRPAQGIILEDWFLNKQNDKDLIIKLHTGEGKTLIGLLMLQSKLNQGKGPCAFFCPNNYLVEQVVMEANKFGIKVCQFENGDFPNEFLQGKKILVSSIQKLFNGKSKFGLDNKYTAIDTLILDDSHACIDSIKNAFTIKIKRDHKLFNDFLQLFENDLKEQGEGKFLDIKIGDYDTLLPIPYWSWIDKKSEILDLLAQYKEEKMILFAWPLLKDSIVNCQCFITGNEIEIVPLHIPTERFSSFANAKQRILMSATTQDDSFFIKGLNFNVEAVNNPLNNIHQKWSGEKMLIIPSLIDESLDRDLIVSKVAPPANLPFGRVSLVASFKRTPQYEGLYANIATTEDIFKQIASLKNGKYREMLVITNRYDGIDLPDNACRILIIDSMPYFNSLADRYEEQCRINSDIVNIKKAQKIEQGLGRSVRGEKDYSVIIIIGADLVKFIKSVQTQKYFSSQTRKQIEIGLVIAELAEADIKKDEPTFKVVNDLIGQSVNRNDAWKEFYREEMNKIDIDLPKSSINSLLLFEKEAEEAVTKGNYEKASNLIQNLIDNHLTVDNEKGWYLQLLARYTYFTSKVESNKIQKSAFESNLQLLKPREGISYKRIEYINENRIKRIKDWISQYTTFEELVLGVDSVLNDLSFGSDSEKFENALKHVGALLGFESQRPDNEYKKGPDNLWCGVDNMYFLFECKSEVSSDRKEINKHEAGQMNSHCGWFEKNYGKEAKVKRILIIPTKVLSKNADLTHQVEVMRKNKLNEFKKAIKEFIKEFKLYKINDISDDKIQSFIVGHKLDLINIKDDYTEFIYAHNL